jgi:formylglycine-generating enzyme required for sulfatase activity
MLVFVGIIQYSIYQGNKSSNTAFQREKGFTLLSDKIKKTKEDISKSEENIRSVKISPEYDSMVKIPGGYFTLGDNTFGDPSTRPAKQVYLDTYFIDKYEVTFAQYYQFVDLTGHRKPRLAGYLAVGPEGLPLLMNPFNPVVGISWDDASAYCIWKKKKLPTEAEWEKAAKGETHQLWPWGNDENPLNANLVGDKDGYFYTAPVGSFKNDKSPYGVYDMAGNVMEWVNDWYSENAYQSFITQNPKGPESGETKVIRGGSWNDSILRAESIVRFKMSPEYRDVTIGFRCAKSA